LAPLFDTVTLGIVIKRADFVFGCEIFCTYAHARAHIHTHPFEVMQSLLYSAG